MVWGWFWGGCSNRGSNPLPLSQRSGDNLSIREPRFGAFTWGGWYHQGPVKDQGRISYHQISLARPKSNYCRRIKIWQPDLLAHKCLIMKGQLNAFNMLNFKFCTRSVWGNNFISKFRAKFSNYQSIAKQGSSSFSQYIMQLFFHVCWLIELYSCRLLKFWPWAGWG